MPGAFTLVEILVVIGVIVVLLSLLGPVLTSLQGARDVNKAVYDIAGLLEQARTYATSNQTYVYVGIDEVAIGQSSSAKPQQTGVGRVVMTVIASKDGTCGYSFSNGSSGSGGSGNQAQQTPNDFFLIGKAQTFDNLHLVNLGRRPDTGSMVRPPYSNDNAVGSPYNLGDSNCTSVTQFYYPLGSNATTASYVFAKVIQFSPQGVARIIITDNSDTISPWLEIGLQQSRGTSVPTLTPPVTTGTVAAIQINGVTGVVRIYRP